MESNTTYFGVFDKPFIPMMLILAFIVVLTFFLFPEFYIGLWVSVVKWQLWLLQWIDPRASTREGAQMTYQFLQARDPGQISFEQIVLISTEVLQFSVLNLIAVLTFIFLAYKIWVKDRFDKMLTLEDLIRSQRGLWPHLEFLSRVDPTKFPADKGPFEERIKPIEYAIRHDLIENFRSKKARERVVRFDALREQMIDDLGERFVSIDKMPVIRQAMVAVALLHLHSKVDGHGFRKERDELLGFLNRIYSNVGWIGIEAKQKQLFEMTKRRVDPILEKYKGDRYLKDACTRHAYEVTVIMRLYQQVNMFGKLTTPTYPFLLPWDRKLFFALHEMDYHESPDLDKKRIRREPKRGASVEAAAAKSHYIAELWTKGRALPEPNLRTAIDAFVNYLVDNSIIQPPEGYSEADSAAGVLEEVWKKFNASKAYNKTTGRVATTVDDAQNQVIPGSTPDDQDGIGAYY